ncbi:MAG: hypothetical protein DDT34_02264 [Firmicutes bacterium]|nr:hypothetical protein [Bacillota bacterium]
MSKEVLAATHQGIWMASGAGSKAVADVTAHMVKDAFPVVKVQKMFAGVNERATLAMLARTRKDGLKLSDRVWRTSESARNSIRTIVEDAVARGQDARTTAKHVQQYLQPGVFKPHKLEVRQRLRIDTDVSYQAMRLARTEMNNAFHEGTIAANQHNPGYRGIFWRLSGTHIVPDVCTDMAADMSHGEPGFYPKGKEPVRPHPQCVAGGTIVSGPKVEASVARWYEGEVIEIETFGGNNLTITPNHPILTAQGWVAASLLNEGSYVVCSNGKQGDSATGAVAVHDPDNHQVPALIEDIVHSFGESGSMTTARVPTSRMDFHGDGIDSEVCVIRANSLLWSDFNSTLLEPGLEQLLIGGSTGLPFFPGQSHFTFSFKRFGHSTNGGVGGLSVAPVVFGSVAGMDELLNLIEGAQSHITTFQELCDTLSVCAILFGESQNRFSRKIASNQFFGIGRRPVLHSFFPRGDALGFEEFSDGVTGLQAVLSGELIRRYAGEIFEDKVLRIRRNPSFAGHVYNLQTSLGWFTANNIITHNCMCVPIPAYEDLDLFVERLREWRDDPSLHSDIDAWYNHGDTRQILGRPQV